ncbi:hypothetical protein SERLA73DRAFT_69800 [Serpula lacrymans var. lacrymans S7.3]|uniref:NACHT domain-containing protein n=2 Tax=Serpula lacrymans var. lacrymans TaxID=341189 RepID=F8PL95_SERL3|nr:uncharacterized protein SERLADRAFT_433864 [Serpula lacrymans var. lacrymans S7.9]EGO04003.1 hypothetical protein SERLA73DRAFT_69800 [Serpula lacrymans var. lacrymans S7.3]EGO29922.1 hypothetical protein SERLADRAFT_433864 [Serpula lacrymans var. lacrymans S7.9]
MGPSIRSHYQGQTPSVRNYLPSSMESSTRERVLSKIKEWADETRPICWLNGPAGFGKTSIAQTIAKWYADEGRLAASFFFARGTVSRDKISRLIPTLAFQLFTTFESAELVIKKALNNKPYIVDSSLSYQFQKLIVEPMLSIAHSERMVIVIDALDECQVQDGEIMDEFIDAVVDACIVQSQVPFRILITSRVEEHIRSRFERLDARPVMLQLKLQDFDATDDIRLLFQSEFAKIYAINRRLMIANGETEPWPSSAILDVCVKQAEGSYMYASTFVGFVGRAGGMSNQQLLDALKAHSLDPLYMQVCSKAVAPSSKDEYGSLRDHKWARDMLLLLKCPLPIKQLSSLLNITSRDLVRSFSKIQSILLISESDDDPIRLAHKSLRDFFMTQSRSGHYFVDVPECHLPIAVDCLAFMRRNKEKVSCTRDGALHYAHEEWLS